MKISTLLVCVFAGAAIFSCSRKDQVSLSVDFNSRPLWKYSLDVSIGGNIRVGDSSSAFDQSLKCILLGVAAPDDSTTVTMTADSVTLQSTMLDDAEKFDILETLDSLELTFSLKDGFAGFKDSLPAQAVHAGQLGLYRQFARMIPVIPDGKIKPGFTWDRNTQMPISTTNGDAAGSMYQSFTFDSLTRDNTGKQLAWLSWEFNYTVAPVKPDTSSIIGDMPHKGSGKGTALMSIKEKCLVSASVEFSIPQGSPSDPFAIEWQEKAVIRLIP